MSTPSEHQPGQDDASTPPAPDAPSPAPGDGTAPTAEPAPTDGWSAVDQRLGGGSSPGYEAEPARDWPTTSFGQSPTSPYAQSPSAAAPYGTDPYGAGGIPGYDPMQGLPSVAGPAPQPGAPAGAPAPYQADPFRTAPPPAAAPGYGPAPAYGPPPGPGSSFGPPRPPLDNLALSAMIVGILSIVTCLFFLGPVGIGLGVAGLRRIRLSGARGHGMAIAGIATGSVASVLGVLFILGMLADQGVI